MNKKPDNNKASSAGEWHQNRQLPFIIFNAVFLAVFFGPLSDLMRTSWQSEYYTYIPFIPIISAYLVYDNRKTIFSKKEYSLVPGLLIMAAGILLVFVAGIGKTLLDHNDYLAIVTCSMVLVWIGGFTFVYGAGSLRAAAFPLLFLLFAVPVPNAAREWVISVLQTGSAELSYWLLKATGTSIARDDFVFHMPKLSIEVAPQCSGIRSSLSLLITGVLAAYFFLRTGWARAILIVLLVPIAILKNGIRISALSLIALYWDESILGSELHRKGGFVFFILALLVTGAVIALLRKMESRTKVPEVI